MAQSTPSEHAAVQNPPALHDAKRPFPRPSVFAYDAQLASDDDIAPRKAPVEAFETPELQQLADLLCRIRVLMYRTDYTRWRIKHQHGADRSATEADLIACSTQLDTLEHERSCLMRTLYNAEQTSVRMATSALIARHLRDITPPSYSTMGHASPGFGAT